MHITIPFFGVHLSLIFTLGLFRKRGPAFLSQLACSVFQKQKTVYLKTLLETDLNLSSSEVL